MLPAPERINGLRGASSLGFDGSDEEHPAPGADEKRAPGGTEGEGCEQVSRDELIHVFFEDELIPYLVTLPMMMNLVSKSNTKKIGCHYFTLPCPLNQMHPESDELIMPLARTAWLWGYPSQSQLCPVLELAAHIVGVEHEAPRVLLHLLHRLRGLHHLRAQVEGL
jgi:hypothetical protein